MRPARPLVRCALLFTLLAVEVALLALRFSTDSLREAGQPQWADLLWRAKFVLPPLGVAIVAAVALFGGERVREALGGLAGARPEPYRAWPFLGAHLAVLALFTRFTAFLLEGGFAVSQLKGLWVTLWLATGVVTVGLWVLCFVPGEVLRALVRRAASGLLGGVAVGLAAWGAGLVTEGWWDPLSGWTLLLVYRLVALVAADPLVEPSTLVVGTERFAVEVHAPCAGYEGIGLVWIFVGTYLVVSRRTLRFPRALLLLPIGTGVVWLANALRLTVLIAIGTWISPAVAVGGFHAYSGSILFAAVALSLVFTARRSAFFSTGDVSTVAVQADAAAENPTAAYLVPFIAIVAMAMVTGAMSAGGPDALYPLKVGVAAAALWRYRRVYRALAWTWSWAAAGAGAVVFALWMALEPGVTGSDDGTGTRAWLASLPVSGAAVWLGFRVLGSVVIVPIAEELAFRGYLARRLVAADFASVPWTRFTWLSFAGSSALFGAMHDRLLAGTLAGMVYALVLYRRGALGDAVLAHATTNALIAGWVLATGSLSLWS